MSLSNLAPKEGEVVETALGFYVPIVCYDEEAEYLHLLQPLVPQVEEQTRLDRWYILNFCSYGSSKDLLFLRVVRLSGGVRCSSNVADKPYGSFNRGYRS